MIGDYRVEAQIGAGTFGTVYRVVQPVIGKRAAIKVLNQEFCDDPIWVSRFVDEARAVNQIHNQHIIDIFTFGTTASGQHYFAMELLEGSTFDKFLRQRGPLPIEVALPILRKIARALDAAHRAGIVHRDLKPENVFLSFDDEGQPVPKLLDFGIAKLLDKPSVRARTQAGTPMGTPLYMSPEQCMGTAVDHRTDIYSLGVIVYETLTGVRPFDGGALELLIMHTQTPPPRLSARRQDLSALDAAVYRMLEKDPARRPASAGEAIEDLAQAAARGGLTVSVASAPFQAVRPPGSSGPAAFASTQHVAQTADASFHRPRAPVGTTFNPPLPEASFAPVGFTPSPHASSAASASGGIRIPAPPPAGGVTRAKSSRAPIIGGAIVVGVLAVVAIALAATRPGKKAKNDDDAREDRTGKRAQADPGSEGCPSSMVAIPAGTFTMGVAGPDSNDGPPHEVAVAAFCIDKTEVTVAAYSKCVEAETCPAATTAVDPRYSPVETAFRSSICPAALSGMEQHPMACVDWYAADAFCHFVNKRLPTEEEWEYAARGTDGRLFPWGNEPPAFTRLNACGSECVAWASDYGRTYASLYPDNDGWPMSAPVGSYSQGASALGLLDMSGNVMEWTTTHFTAGYGGEEDPDTKVVRGGGFEEYVANSTSATHRTVLNPGTRTPLVGMRCVK